VTQTTRRRSATNATTTQTDGHLWLSARWHRRAARARWLHRHITRPIIDAWWRWRDETAAVTIALATAAIGEPVAALVAAPGLGALGETVLGESAQRHRRVRPYRRPFTDICTANNALPAPRIAYAREVHAPDGTHTATILDGHLHRGDSIRRFHDLTQAFADAWPALTCELRQLGPGKYRWEFRHASMLDRDLVFDPTLAATVDAIPLGQDRDGVHETLDLREAAALFAGQRGGGKSTSLRSVLAYLIPLVYRSDIDLHLLDPEPDGINAIDFKPWAATFATGIPDVLAALRDLHLQSQIRQPHPGDPLQVIVCDEFGRLVTNQDKKQRDTAHHLLTELISIGRKRGYPMLLATQDVHRDVMPSRFISQITHSLVFASRTIVDAQVAAGPGITSPAAIPYGQPGRAVLVEGSREREIRCYRLLDLSMLDRYPIPPGMSDPTPQRTPALKIVSNRTPADRLASIDAMGRSTPKGLSKREVADRFGVSERTVARDFDELGFVKVNGRHVHPVHLRAEVAAR
jgi:hypothetical protein